MGAQGLMGENTVKSEKGNKLLCLYFLRSSAPCLVWIVIGMDRFYKGDIWLGILKLFGVPILFVCGGIAVFVFQQGEVFFIFLIPIVLWIIVDFFLVYKGIKKDNFEKINNQLLLFGV